MLILVGNRITISQGPFEYDWLSLDKLHVFLQQKKEAGTLNDKELVSEAERLDVKDKAPLVLAEVLLDNDKSIMQLMKQYRKHFLRVITARNFVTFVLGPQANGNWAVY